MKRVLQRLLILSVVFFAAAVGYFFWMRARMSGGDTIYISMEESVLPVVYMDTLGREMNCLHGYVQETGSAGAQSCLTVLPENRRLGIRIGRCQGNVTGIYYEIRSLDRESLVERTSVEDWTVTEDGARAELPIQNLLQEDREYLMTLTVDTDSQGAVRYHTRIVQTDNGPVRQMVDLAADFSARTFSYEQARELVTYLESDSTGDNSNLGRVDIHSSFSQITWGSLNVEPAGEFLVTLNELNGLSAQVTVEYLAVRKTEDGESGYYEAEDNFTMRMGEQRVYMMDFDRKVDQVFMGGRENFVGNRIMLGIAAGEQMQAVKSADESRCAFITAHDLWSYDEKGKQAMRLFSFRSSKEEGIRPVYKEHGLKILQVEDNGDVRFLAYGYMGRGNHEGCVGVAMYQYNSQEDALEEHFFIPVTESYEELKLDLTELSYLSPAGVLYVKIGHGVYGIDMTSNECVVVAEGLMEGGYAVSQDGRRIAWQDGRSIGQSKTIHLIDLDTGEKDEVTSENGDNLRTLGFVGNDLIYGLARADSRWVVNGREEELPMYALAILGEDMEILSRYEKAGFCITQVTVEDSRIHLTWISPVSDTLYQPAGTDTIVCNEEIPDDKMANIGWYADSERQRLYFVQTSGEITENRDIQFSAPEKIAYETSEILELGDLQLPPGMQFYAYGGGHLLGVTEDLSTAVSVAYEKMGTVTDADRHVLWNRVDRPQTGTVQDAGAAAGKMTKNAPELSEGSRSLADGTLLLDARGCSLSQVLYFVGKGCPVLAYGENGESLLLTAYDQYNVTLYQPETGESWKMGLNDATEYFARTGNDFICSLSP